MNIELNEARQKKADELGLPYRLENECVIHRDGWQVAEPRTLGEYPLLFMMESANRVLQLEQAVEGLRKLVTSGWECGIDLAGEWNWKRDTITENIREMSELDTFIKESDQHEI